MRLRLRGQGSFGIGGGGATATRFGTHVYPGADYFPTRLWANLFFDSSRPWTNETTGQNYPLKGDSSTSAWGWPKAVTTGTTISRLLKFSWMQARGTTPGQQYLKPGTYKIRVAQSGWNVDIDAVGRPAGWTSKTAGAGVCTFTVTAGLDPFTIRLLLTRTGATADLTPANNTVQAYETAHESLLDADPLAIYPASLTHFAGFDELRFVEQTSVNGDYDIPTVASIAPKSHFMEAGFWPPEIMAHFARAIDALTVGGTGVQIQLPSLIDRSNPTTDAVSDRIAMINWPQVDGSQNRHVGNAQAVTSTTITLASDASTSDGFYNGAVVALMDGSAYATISGYVGSTRVATVGSWTGSTPTGTPRYCTRPLAAPPNGAQMYFAHYDNAAFAAMGLTEFGPWVVANRTAYTFQIAHPSTPTTPLALNTTGLVDVLASEARDYSTAWGTIMDRFAAEWATCPRWRPGVLLETWNGDYVHQSIEMTHASFLKDGSRTVQDYVKGHAYLTLLAWSLSSSRFGARAIRILESGIANGNSRIMDQVDNLGLVSTGATLGSLVEEISVATYYLTSQAAAVPAYGSLDWRNDPALTTAEIFSRIGLGTVNEPTMIRTQATVEALMAANSNTISNALFLERQRASLHVTELHLRCWMNKMDSFGRTLGVHYFFHAYEWKNHQRNDRSGAGTVGDVVMQFQDQYIAFDNGNSTEAVAFRADVLAMHTRWNFRRVNTYYLFGGWNGRLADITDFGGGVGTYVSSWGALPWQGADADYPSLAHTINWIRANSAGVI